ncbi:MAG: alcohol dehydrogenase catalytic domain-containing protein [Nitrososphaerales archaeon]
MKSIQLRDGGKVAFDEVQIPNIGKQDLLVRMKACGLCGTDIEKIHGEYTASAPVLGHEASGVIQEVGADIKGFAVGERVFPHHHVPCYECYVCRNGNETMCTDYRANNLDPGGFSEFFRVPSWNVLHGGVLKLPDNVTFEQASFIEPVACCLRNIKRCNISEAHTILILGAGPMGLMHLQLLLLSGNTVLVSDLSSMRLELANRLGASMVCDPKDADIASKVRAQTDGRGVDLAIVATGSPNAIMDGLRSVRPGGTVNLFGVPVRNSVLDYDISNIVNSEISITPSNAATESETKEALGLITQGKPNFEVLITHNFKLEEFNEAVSTATHKESVKILISS